MRRWKLSLSPFTSGGSKNVLPTRLQWSNSDIGLDTDVDLTKIVGGPAFVWGPLGGSTGDPDGLDPCEVPADVLTSLPHDSS